MRYYSFVLGTTSDQIKQNAKINLRDYGYDNAIASMNTYMFRNMKNNLTFFIYREEERRCPAVFSFDEGKDRYEIVYKHIILMLNETFGICRTAEEPCEITMHEYLECFQEGRRREYVQMSSKIIESANMWLYYFDRNEPLRYEFRERIIADGQRGKDVIYDPGFCRELDNIEAHSSSTACKENMVHYVLACHGVDSAADMTSALMQSLYKAGRISSRRMAIITDIHPEVYRGNNYLENIIENNFGGVVVFDLSEKFGKNVVEYVQTANYIEKLLKRYRRNCLFVFTYNMENPGFSYMLLPKLGNYVCMLSLREGKADRKAAVRYLEELIRDSEYAEYAGQAAEYMQSFHGDEFTQTEVLTAFDRFGAWSINHNVLKAYDPDLGDGFRLDHEADEVSPSEKLEKLIGLGIVKKQIHDIIAMDKIERERKKYSGKAYSEKSLHMVFGGNPGSAKTTVARLFAGIAKERGILKSGIFVERGGMDLQGCDPAGLVRNAFLEAKGGVLFIDEAYTLVSPTAIATLIQEMENRRGEVIVILAGYNDEMKEFMDRNEGLKSRIPNWVDFPDYSTEELMDIFCLMLKERGFHATEEALKEAQDIFDKARRLENFGNGRYVRNILERAIREQSARLLSCGKKPDKLGKKELFCLTKEDIRTPEDGMVEVRPEGTARKELDAMVGLEAAKKVIYKAIANYKLNRICMERGFAREKSSLHMVFTGNPGTAKTTVARLLAEILRDEKVLASGSFVETGRADLVSMAIGATPGIIKEKFKEANGGILFIDEAYSLLDGAKGAIGDEAITTIVQEMENHRDDVIVIFAGYPEPMKEFLEHNPGMRSRIAFEVNFEDYSTEELCEITDLMLSRKQMKLTDTARNKLCGIYKEARENRDYGNGRFVRKLLEEARMNMAERIMNAGLEDFSDDMLTTIDECDIPDWKAVEKTSRKIGFYS